MEDLVEKINEKFLKCILSALDPAIPVEISHSLTSAYLTFAQAAKTMQDMELDLDSCLCGDECCQF